MGKTNDSQKETSVQTNAPAVSAPVSAPAPTKSAPAPTAWSDEHHGAGGAYELVNGQRVLVGRTQAATAA